MANLYGAAVNSFDLDPLQGQDAEVFFLDNATGLPAFFGHLQSFTFSVRDSTETYLTLGSRHPTYLSGEIQVAWVAEQAMVDTAMLARALGQADIGRHTFAGKSPKFTIALDFYAQDLVNPNNSNGANGTPDFPIFESGASSVDNINIYASNAGQYQQILSQRMRYNSGPKTDSKGARAMGRIEFINCKWDSFSGGIMPGKRTIAQRLEGVAEGFRYIADKTVQQYKDEARRKAREFFIDEGGATR